jgi:hypothetical protein
MSEIFQGENGKMEENINLTEQVEGQSESVEQEIQGEAIKLKENIEKAQETLEGISEEDVKNMSKEEVETAADQVRRIILIGGAVAGTALVGLMTYQHGVDKMIGAAEFVGAVMGAKLILGKIKDAVEEKWDIALFGGRTPSEKRRVQQMKENRGAA